MLLKRLSGSLPPKLANLIPDLEAAGIKTTESLIFTAPSTILNDVPIFSTVQLEYLVSECIRLTTSSAISGDIIPMDELEWSGFGVQSLDDLFEGWDGVGLIELAGPEKVGKSLLALHAAIRVLIADEEAMCTWIDTEGSFSPERAKQILEVMRVDEPNHVLRRIVVVNALKLEDLFEAVAQLKEIVRMMLIFQTGNAGHAELISLMDDIAEMTYSENMLTLIINSTAWLQTSNPQSSFNRTEIYPRLGSSFTFTTDDTLLLQNTGHVFSMMDHVEKNRMINDIGLRALVEVIRSRISPTGIWGVFETDGVKLFDVLPPHEVDERSTRISAGLPTGPYRPIIGSLAQTLIP
uniref:Rad51-like C-terminal domain-containing protein n=1 Tax=Kwoniella dejecticola CBS 10117 TaxID=1296121 RepID=A0A1A6AGG2_9TREE|nr:uncharacterized protein I303_00958 [Kwoniella dejecticola CBS 10117]OBR89136.1 hypothetical protein I303_00958 [Kwoniella dejecticola CBS 10117]